ncbi:Uncharacterised protein [Mycobacteroides abscessus subsp. abscessus]|nr:Uncharacterised protein [Mycobacteroides abscessus subsp. abscessus]
MATKAGYRVRNPTITLMVLLPQSEVMMLRPSGCRTFSGCLWERRSKIVGCSPSSP